RLHFVVEPDAMNYALAGTSAGRRPRARRKRHLIVRDLEDLLRPKLRVDVLRAAIRRRLSNGVRALRQALDEFDNLFLRDVARIGVSRVRVDDPVDGVAGGLLHPLRKGRRVYCGVEPLGVEWNRPASGRIRWIGHGGLCLLLKPLAEELLQPPTRLARRM